MWSEGLEDLRFVRFDARGNRMGAPVQLTEAPGRSMSPSLVGDGDGWALAFEDERDAPEDRGGYLAEPVRITAPQVLRAALTDVTCPRTPATPPTRSGATEVRGVGSRYAVSARVCGAAVLA